MMQGWYYVKSLTGQRHDRKSRDKGQLEKSRISYRCRDKVIADRHKLSRRKSWPNHVKNEQHIGSENTYGPKNTEQFISESFKSKLNSDSSDEKETILNKNWTF